MAQAETHPKARLRLRPFAAMRFNPAAVDIAEVMCPPYDVMDRAMIETLLNAHPRNVVRLILPRLVREPPGADDPYVAAAKRLDRWRRQGTLVTDPEPGLYVYEYGDPTHRVCGLVGALGMAKHNRDMILSHEDVIPAIVADQLAMVVTSRANLEPILLAYDGDDVVSAAIESARAGDPLTDLTAAGGSFHRVWSITDPPTLRQIRAAIQGHQALIADGHHRFATYRQLRRRHRALGGGSGPWDRGLAMLVDQSEYPLELGAIHRSVAEVALSSLNLPPGFEAQEPRRLDGEPARPPQESGGLVLSDGVQEVTVHLRRTGTESVTDVERLHEELLPAWSVTEDRIGYHHSVQQTLHHAAQEDGVAILLHAPTISQVMTVARTGKVMPRKSTSFRPKPSNGLVMRSFEDD